MERKTTLHGCQATTCQDYIGKDLNMAKKGKNQKRK